MEVNHVDVSNVDELLIEEVRKYPWLYDLQRKDNKDHEKKEATWNEITLALQRHEQTITKEDLTHRWRALREKFARERKQYYLSNGTVGRRKWHLYDNMSFLTPYIRHKGRLYRSLSTKDFDTQLIVDPDENSSMEESLDAPADMSHFKDMGAPTMADTESPSIQNSPYHTNKKLHVTTSVIPTRQSRILKRKLATQKPCNTPELYTRILSSLRTLENQDEEDHFASIVASTLRRLKPINKAKIKLEISKLLLQCEIEQLEEEEREKAETSNA